ncbi:polyprenol monophosphomannose synthase [Rhodoluna limnophila]|uniref:polyprenol monophosphomannose synthase n=1 Tax=Rhodoluna limnophila TaxID=232537 RepID=UPI001C12C9DF|nr:polyprenol monophosphomannose synthase [Rhodoluna limnophila]
MRTLVLMPTFNEIESLAHSVAELREVCPQVDLLIIDDNSPDGTGHLADRLAAKDPQISVLHRSEKGGLGAAYLSGFGLAIDRGYEIVIEMDADGSHRAIDLPKILEKAQTADLVIGSRWIPGGAVVNWPAHRKAISKIGNLYANLMLRTGIKDMTAGFRAFNVEFLKGLNLEGVAARGYAFQVEMALRSKRAGGEVVEVPITFVERTLGSSKMTTAIVLEALWLVTKWGFYRSA